MQRNTDVAVIGGGLIGLAIAWRCAQRGMTAVVLDPQPDRGAWRTAAGMLAPIGELDYSETPLLRLNRDSAGRYPAFAAEVADAAGVDIGFRTCGSLAVAWDAADFAALRDLAAFAQRLGERAEMVTGRELRELEPAVAPGLPGGLLAPNDHQIDPRLLHAGLRAAAQAAGVQLVSADAGLAVDGTRVRGVHLADGTTLEAGDVVLAAGCWSGAVHGLPPGAAPPVRPVKGQTLRLRLPGPPRLSRVVRASVKGSKTYLLPRADGRIVVGANVEEAAFDQQPRAGAIYELLRDAQSLLPELGEAVFEEVSTGLRPGSPDNAPLVGRGALDGLVVATGHYRNGVLLTPVTADGVAALLADGALPDVLMPFTPNRFADTAAEVART